MLNPKDDFWARVIRVVVPAATIIIILIILLARLVISGDQVAVNKIFPYATGIVYTIMLVASYKIFRLFEKNKD